MPTLEEELLRLMTEETARLHAAPDLVERVVRGSRRRRTRSRIAALSASVAVVAAPVAYLGMGSATTTGGEVTISATPEPPAIDDVPPQPSEPPTLGDLGDGKAFGHVKVGYLPKRLIWSRWSVNFGDKYSTAYGYEGDDSGFYRVQIYMYEQATVEEVADRIAAHRDEGEGEEVTVGDRTGYLVVQDVGEDGMKGTPTLFLKMGERQWAEIMISPVYAGELGDADAVTAELRRIAEGLTSTL
ncbi:hypothetical protein ACIA8R_49580 [Nonomuraea sp. NPDC051191]|uniref:hypothetical protein n=1 Tax=Nonomuraea sp. NPDC051191 TaxID=3364372 RepID=UPI0037BD0923